MTGRPANIPTRGDVSARLVAQLMGLSAGDFEIMRPQLEQRGFPGPDPTTGNYCIEAVDRWRKSRFAAIFPELTASPMAKNASTVFEERLRRVGAR